MLKNIPHHRNLSFRIDFSRLVNVVTSIEFENNKQLLLVYRVKNYNAWDTDRSCGNSIFTNKSQTSYFRYTLKNQTGMLQ